MSKQLQNASEYDYIKKQRINIFVRGKERINLFKITNKNIERLLREDSKYWNTHFKKKQTRKKKSESSDAQ